MKKPSHATRPSPSSMGHGSCPAYDLASQALSRQHQQQLDSPFTCASARTITKPAPGRSSDADPAARACPPACFPAPYAPLEPRARASAPCLALRPPGAVPRNKKLALFLYRPTLSFSRLLLSLTTTQASPFAYYSQSAPNSMRLRVYGQNQRQILRTSDGFGPY
jgi:hypothetical protein